ncbi:MAG: DMT family transporter [Rhodospirillaceae bacterium]|nr:DMT family transporter [Rhodospirillaceae bacterium]
MTPSPNLMMNATAWTLLITLSVLWGGSFFFVGVAVRDLPPLTIVTLRVLGGAVALNIVLLALRLRLPSSPHIWRNFFVMGLLNNALPFCLLVWAQTQIASGLASILNAATPMATVLLAHVMTDDEKMTVNRVAGVMIGIAGVAVMIGADVLGSATGTLMAQLACVAATVSYALAGIYGRRFKTMNLSPLITATGQLTAAVIMLAPVTLLIDRPWLLPAPSTATWQALAGIALLSTALAYILYFRILALAGATNIALVTLLVPVSAILLGTLALGERLDASHVLGFSLIAAGLGCIDGRPLRWLRAKAG